jgi:hypothetical protein
MSDGSAEIRRLKKEPMAPFLGVNRYARSEL